MRSLCGIIIRGMRGLDGRGWRGLAVSILIDVVDT